MRLIFGNVEGTVPRHAQSGFRHTAVHHSDRWRPQTDRVRECCVATAVGDPQKRTAAAEAPSSRSPVLDVLDEDLETMENGDCHCATRYRCELAAAAIQALLVEAVPEEGTRNLRP
jgi:hypothetical protein